MGDVRSACRILGWLWLASRRPVAPGPRNVTVAACATAGWPMTWVSARLSARAAERGDKPLERRADSVERYATRRTRRVNVRRPSATRPAHNRAHSCISNAACTRTGDLSHPRDPAGRRLQPSTSLPRTKGCHCVPGLLRCGFRAGSGSRDGRAARGCARSRAVESRS